MAESLNFLDPTVLASLDNLELWFTARRIYQEGARDGVDLPIWWDQSGNNRHAYQHAAGKNPSLSMVGANSDIPVVRFDSSNQERLTIGDVEVHSNSAGRGLWIVVLELTLLYVYNSVGGGFKIQAVPDRTEKY